MSKNNKKIIASISAVFATAILAIVLVGATNNWFISSKTTLDQEYYSTSDESLVMDKETYDKLVAEEKSFLIITYLPGCTAKLIEYAKNFSQKHNVAFYYYNFSKLKESSLHDFIKYAPSVAVISKGKVVRYLRSDNNDDAEYYNSYDSFETWLESLIVL